MSEREWLRGVRSVEKVARRNSESPRGGGDFAQLHVLSSRAVYPFHALTRVVAGWRNGVCIAPLSCAKVCGFAMSRLPLHAGTRSRRRNRQAPPGAGGSLHPRSYGEQAWQGCGRLSANRPTSSSTIVRAISSTSGAERPSGNRVECWLLQQAANLCTCLVSRYRHRY